MTRRSVWALVFAAAIALALALLALVTAPVWAPVTVRISSLEDEPSPPDDLVYWGLRLA